MKSKKVLINRGWVEASAAVIESIVNIYDAPSPEAQADRMAAFTRAWGRTPAAALRGIAASMRSVVDR